MIYIEVQSLTQLIFISDYFSFLLDQLMIYMEVQELEELFLICLGSKGIRQKPNMSHLSD